MLRIRVCLFAKVIPVALFLIFWGVAHLAVVAGESAQYEEGGGYPVGKTNGKRDLKKITVTKPIDGYSFSESGSSNRVFPIKKNRVEKSVNMLIPVEGARSENCADALTAVEVNDSQKKYAINLIPSSLVKAPRDGSSAIVVEKDSQTLWLYTSKKGEFVRILEIPCSTGEVDGPKMVEGDKKTPEGIYFMKQIHEERFLAPIYGKRAFTTDYPNFLDRLLGKTGSAIWIHGTNKRLKPMDSNGCVAMNNDDIIKIGPYVVLDETPLIIMDKVDYTYIEATVAQRTALLNFLASWIASLNNGSYLEYLFNYSSNYLPDVRWWAEWVKIRSTSAMTGNPIAAKFDHIGIYRHKDHFVVLLDFEVYSRYRTIAVGKRKLFIIPPVITSSAMGGGIKTGIETAISQRGNKTILQREEMATSFSCSNDSYKIIGDVFQAIAMDKADRNNQFITAAARLNGQSKAK